MKASKRVHRLAVLLGLIASTLWLFSLMVNIKRLDMIEPLGWVLIFILTGMVFLIPFLLVHGIAWVSRRFREDK
jgi:drug/metabolite transporter (DMT)-like permease